MSNQRRTGASKPRGRKRHREPNVAPADICGVVFCDQHLVAVDKHAGFPVLPSGAHRERSVIKALAAMGMGQVFPVNQLDREATGLVLLSRSESAAKALRWNWRSNLCKREFIAVAQGDVTGARGRITLPIGTVKEGGRIRRQVVEDGGRSAVTHWRLLARGRGMSRMLITLNQGRCHQIRIHLAAIGHPVVNERLYLDRTTEIPLAALVDMPDVRKKDIRKMPSHQIGLHSYRVHIPHPMTNEALTLEAPIPRALTDLMPGAWVVDAI
ncbi:MAG: RluA family pseudouridine synthase [Myxococcales bacterium]|nr:RluA family pseudouridine synthase [Myxococcales bacterium]